MTIHQDQLAVANRVGAAAIDITNLLQAYYDQVFKNAQAGGEWAGDDFRLMGLATQAVGICLFQPMYDQWSPNMALVVFGSDPMIQWGTPINAFGLWPHPPGDDISLVVLGEVVNVPDLVSWDEHPFDFADQIEKIYRNLRKFVGARAALIGLAIPDQTGDFGAASTPEPVIAAMETAISVLESPAAKTVMGMVGLGGEGYAIPIFGWALAIIDAIIDLAYAIFGTAKGVDNIAPTPFQPGEAENWTNACASVVVALRKLIDQCHGGTALRESASVRSRALVRVVARPVKKKPVSHAALLSAKVVGHATATRTPPEKPSAAHPLRTAAPVALGAAVLLLLVLLA